MSVESRPIDEPAPMHPSEVKRRATAGAVLLTARGAFARILGFGGTVVLARLLVPKDFGLVALGLAAYQVVWLLSDAGIGAALVRRPQPPRREELRSILGFQLLITTALAIATVLIALLLGQGALVVAVVVLSLPLMAFRAPGALLLERELAYRPLARVQVVEMLTYYGWAVTTVVLGLGVWGLASASIVMALAGSVLIAKASPMRIIVPKLSWRSVKPFIGFGWRFQAATAAQQFQTQGLNVGVAAIGGAAELGLWTLAMRILLAPFLLFRSLSQVSYPAMSRLIAAGESPTPVVKRSVCLVAIAAGAMYAPVIGSAPALVPGVFGDKWDSVVDVIPTAALGQMIIVPISIAATGYLYAIGDAAVVLRRNIVQAAVCLGLGFPLLIAMGIAGLGVASLITALVGAAIMSQAVKRRLGVGVISPLTVPVGVASAAAAGGWVVASEAAPSIGLTVETAVLSELLFLVGIAATQRPAMSDLLRLGRRGIRNAVARPSQG